MDRNHWIGIYVHHFISFACHLNLDFKRRKDTLDIILILKLWNINLTFEWYRNFYQKNGFSDQNQLHHSCPTCVAQGMFPYISVCMCEFWSLCVGVWVWVCRCVCVCVCVCVWMGVCVHRCVGCYPKKKVSETSNTSNTKARRLNLQLQQLWIIGRGPFIIWALPF